MCIVIILGIITILILLWWLYSSKAMLPRIDEKTVLVTGAGSGFGKAIVKKLLDEGVTVFAACHRQESLDQLTKEFKDRRGHLEAFDMDITSAESVKTGLAFVEETLEETGKELHAIIHNAGIRGKFFIDSFMTIDDYKNVVDVNTFGAIRVTHAFEKLIKKSKGRLIYCTSSTIMFPPPGMAPYTLSKFALTGYTSCIRHELLPYGIKVITVQPGIFQTKLNEVTKVLKETEKVWKSGTEKMREEYGYYYYNKGKRVYVDVVEMSSTDVTPVAEAYFQAVFAKYPRLNYIVGKDAKYIFQPCSWMPLQLQVFITSMLYKMFNGPIPAVVDIDEY